MVIKSGLIYVTRYVTVLTAGKSMTVVPSNKVTGHTKSYLWSIKPSQSYKHKNPTLLLVFRVMQIHKNSRLANLDVLRRQSNPVHNYYIKQIFYFTF